MQRVIGVVISAILGVFLLALAWLNGAIMEFPLPGQLMAARSAERLTAAACNGNADCISEKAPIASYAEYRRCGGYIESERAGESRLACSEAWLSDVYMRMGGAGSSFYRQFRRACRVHDFCYVHAEATYDPKYGKGPAQDRCDRMLLADIVRDCRLLYPTAKLHDDRMKCFRNAMAAYTGVRLQGSKSFSSAKPALCDYEPGPHAPRDHVISGRFVKGRPESLATIVEEPDFRGISVELHALSGDGGSKPILPVARFTPKDVAVADRDRACELPEWSAADTCTAPSTLGDAGFQSADWLRFAPIVIDSDGDGVDEIILVSLTPRAGLVFTHLKTSGEGEYLGFEPPKAYVAVDYIPLKKRKEFGVPGQAGEPPLSNEKAIQMLSHQLVVLARSPDDCSPPYVQAPEDIAFFGSRAEPEDRIDPSDGDDAGIQIIKHRMYRFTFDVMAGHWIMFRDSYADDNHKMSECAYGSEAETRGQQIRQHQLSRLEYPALAVRGPVRCGRISVIRETLSAMSRERCPSSSAKAEAGELNDVDLMKYTINTDYAGDDHLPDPVEALKLVGTSWLPLTWNEAADPVLTSRAARRAGVDLVSIYAGGRKPKDDKSHFFLMTVLKNDLRPDYTAKAAWRVRLPDTIGQPPEQYALLQAGRNIPRSYWSRKELSDPKIFLDLPSVLAPFWINGGPGLSLVMFANRETFEHELKLNGDPGKAAVAPGTLQVLIVPIVNDGPEVDGRKPLLREPRWLECAVPEDTSLAAKPARSGAEWIDGFLYREPVLPGEFFPDRKGGLAIAYRTNEGRLAFTSLQNRPSEKSSDVWWLGQNKCHSLSADGPDNTPPERGIIMMRVN